MRVELVKMHQGYSKKPILPVCKNCKNFVFEWYHYDATSTKTWAKAPVLLGFQKASFRGKFRCEIGGFAVIETASCARFEDKI